MDQVNSIGTQIAVADRLDQGGGARRPAAERPARQARPARRPARPQLGNVSVSTTAGTAGTLGAIDVTIGGTTLVTDTTASTLTLPLTSLTSGKLAGMQAVLTSISDPTTGYLTRLNHDRLGARLEHEHPARARHRPERQPGRHVLHRHRRQRGRHDRRQPGDPRHRRRSSPPRATARRATPATRIALADLQRSTLIGGATIDGAYSQLVTQIGSDSQQSQQSLDNATSLVDSLSNRRQSVSGVSLDEEMAKLLQFQRGYQASARALTAMDDMINELISRTGRVGL